MNGKDILNAMNFLEEELVERSLQEAPSLCNRKSKLTKTAFKWAAVAAAAVLFLGGGVAYAAKYGLLRKDIDEETGYLFSVTSRRVTEDEFSEEVRAVKSELSADISVDEDGSLYYGWMEKFDTPADCVEFIGHAGMKVPSYPGTATQTCVVVVGNPQAEILMVEASAHYNLDKMMITGNATVYTTSLTKETLAGIKGDDTLYEQENYITATGREAVIMIPTEKEGHIHMHGYLVDDSVIYELWISYYEEDEAQALQLMKEWLDQF